MKPFSFTNWYRYRWLLVLAFSALLIALFSSNSRWVEQYYTYGAYPAIAKGLRLLFGWLPFSFGDLLYGSAFIYLVILTIRLFRLFMLRKLNRGLTLRIFRKLLYLALLIYLLFNLLWGLNYNRQGIDYQLGLTVSRYSVVDLTTLTTVLQQRLNGFAQEVDTLQRKMLNQNRFLFNEGIHAYKTAQQRYPYLRYSVPSIKPSLFTHIGHFFGFTGYYNPFSGEAQIKTTAPLFLKPFVVAHEIAHQLGYAKENEANLVAFLVGRESGNIDVRYSVYFEMYLYAISELKRKDSITAKKLAEKVHPQVKSDEIFYYDYLEKSRNPVEPYITLFYDQYLKWNRQPKGTRTYNEVIAWLMAYMKKGGTRAI